MSDTIVVSDRRKPPPGFPWYVLPGLAIMAEVVFLAALVMSYMGEDKTLLNVMCTAAIAQAATALNYYFGSSAGSAKKDDAIAASASKPAVLTTTKTEAPPPPPDGGTAKPTTTTTQTQTGGTP